jgi:hypothetical protein
MILWEGESLIDGAPIVLIGTKDSRNLKTGAQLQTWIMRADLHPHAAVKSGDDVSVCGDCPQRPALGGGCYVVTWQAPASTWGAYQRGRHDRARSPADLIAFGSGEDLRIGAYGDPGAVPLGVWQMLASDAKSVTGFTHQWRRADPGLASLCMASVESLEEAALARAMGWRTYRIRQADEPLGEREFVCPASAEAGKRLQCQECRACGGTGAKARAHPVIISHGPRARFAITRSGSKAA